MSQTTRCPACQTLFKVVPDQLRVSEGWVRCGQCSEIFDAALHLYQPPQIASQAHGIETPNASVAVVTVKPADLPRPAGLVDTPVRLDIEVGIDLALQQAGMAEPVESVDAPDPLALKPVSGQASAQQAPPKERAVEKLPLQILVAADDPIAKSESNRLPVPDRVPPVSFLRDVQHTSAWLRPRVRVVLGLAGASLLAALALQVVVHERDRIAASIPDAKPALAGICTLLHCKISSLRQIESVVIDSSTFTKLRGDAYRLAFTVKNTSAIELAMPALELTLTDSQDQPALRRVFVPSEFGATSNALAAGSEWAVSVPIAVRPNAGGERITGYRILAFYP